MVLIQIIFFIYAPGIFQKRPNQTKILGFEKKTKPQNQDAELEIAKYQ